MKNKPTVIPIPPIPVLIIVGPTASGKSALAVDLARRFHGEVISADSRQVYKGLDIGTGKITKQEMKDVPHHLLDVADPRIPVHSPRHYSVEKWREAAATTIENIHMRGHLPIICGGTGFYISALIDGMTFPNVPPNLRLRTSLLKKTTDELFDLLKKVDPRRANDMQKNGDFKNTRRIIRAIEIATALGKVPRQLPQKKSAKISSLSSISKKYSPIFIGISLPEDVLKNRIEKRLTDRLQSGMIDEVKNLHERTPGFSGRGLSSKRMRELGLEYRYIAEYLQNKTDEKTMIEKLKTESWRYAKRQMTWWKRDKRILWLPPEKIEERVAELFVIESLDGLK